jgi:hypothetical protein
MRKKADTATGTASPPCVSNKVITKKPRTSVPVQTTRGGVAGNKAPTPTTGACTSTTDSQDRLGSHMDTTIDDNTSAAGSRERSISPMESDLLRYLTAHISPPCFVDSNAGGSFCGDVTSFVIERGEYLEGIVRLIQSDCPEVVDDMASFVCAIEQAFSKVTGLKALE